jgi:hypothetical protein
MDKFLIRNCSNSSIDTSQTNESSSSSQLNSSWNTYVNPNTNIKVQKSSKKFTKGWTYVKGVKMYGTYRDGKRVYKPGREGMMLAVSDSSKNKNHENN